MPEDSKFDKDDLRNLWKTLGPQKFADMVELSIWIAQAKEDIGLELIYMDEELITFRRKK